LIGKALQILESGALKKLNKGIGTVLLRRVFEHRRRRRPICLQASSMNIRRNV